MGGRALKTLLTRLLSDESGQGLTEYALILALVAVALVAIVVLFRNAIGGVFDIGAQTLNNAQTATPYTP